MMGTINRAAPFQHKEVFLVLRHFFKGNNPMLKERLPTGIYDTQILEPMVALVATTVSNSCPPDFGALAESSMTG